MQITIDTDKITAYEVRSLAKLLCATVCGASGQLENLEADAEKRPVDMLTDELHIRIADLNQELYSRRTIKPDDNPASGVEAAALNSDAGGYTLTEVFRLCEDPKKLLEIIKEAPVTHVTIPTDRGEFTVDKTKTDLDAAFAEATGKTLDLAAVFGAASGKPTDSDIAGENQKSTDEQTPTATLDKNNLPWDARIHAASKAVNADGTWRQRRGVDAALVATVERELRGVMALPGPTSSEADKHIPAGVDIDGPHQDQRSPDSADAFAMAAAAVSPPKLRPPLPPKPPTPPLAASETVIPKGEPLPDDAADPRTFPQLLKFITAGKLAGKFNQAQVGAALVAIGVEGPLPVLQARPDLIPAMVARLRAIGGA